jgi:hypothetical protein
MRTHIVTLVAALLLGASLPARAQEQVLEGRLTRSGDDVWLVRADGTRVSVPFDHRSEARTALCPLTDHVVRFGARVTTERGVPTARVTRLVDPTLETVRARVEAGGSGLTLVGSSTRRVLAEGRGEELLRPLVGVTVDVRAYLFARGDAIVQAVRARARRWHFQPIVAAPILLLPRWKRPGSEYWITSRGENGELYVGLRHLNARDFDFAAPSASVGAAGRLASVGR